MKEKYFKPETNIDEFKTVDIISTSDYNDLQDDDNPIPWG